jgi:AcrR family transcriptional regulator
MDKAERRQQILNHARDVFALRGYHAAKIEDIVAAAGVARGTFYLYFEDKRAIFEEIVDGVLARIGMTIVRVDPHDASHRSPSRCATTSGASSRSCSRTAPRRRSS